MIIPIFYPNPRIGLFVRFFNTYPFSSNAEKHFKLTLRSLNQRSLCVFQSNNDPITSDASKNVVLVDGVRTPFQTSCSGYEKLMAHDLQKVNKSHI